jgi:CDP-diacylglycerol--glycerol-3-phosphate 3-phosphatidyltransferase
LSLFHKKVIFLVKLLEVYDMTLANKITIFRICLVPIMIITAYMPYINDNYLFWNISIGQLIILALFIIGSLSDFLDGYIARKRQQVTTFGKFLDPIADKILTITALLYLVKLDMIEVWIVLIIILREFIVSGIRLITAKKDIVIAASFFGKLKTVITMITIIWLLFNEFNLGGVTFGGSAWLSWMGNTGLVGAILLLVTVIATIGSGADYFIKSREHLFESM